MSILSGVFKKFKDYILIDGKYVLSSRWTKSDAVIMGDGSDDSNTLEKNLGSVKGITDSLTATSSNVALSAAAGKSLQDQVTSVNSHLGNKVSNNNDGADSLLSKITTSWTAAPTDDTNFIRQDTDGGNTFGRVKFSTLWSYIKGKTDKIYAASNHTHSGYAASNHTHSGYAATNHTHSGYAATNHKQAYAASELDTYTADENTMGVTPAGVRKAINGRFSRSGTTLYINTL